MMWKSRMSDSGEEQMFKGIALGLSVLAISSFMVVAADAKGRTGSHRSGGYNSHGKGSHYYGGHTSLAAPSSFMVASCDDPNDRASDGSRCGGRASSARSGGRS
jgi:hypothetical protein